jgi:anti-anti-sigma regulatory factor
MKPRLTSALATLTRHPGNQARTGEALVHPLIIRDRGNRAREAHARPQLTLASPSAWQHKLILTGRLHRGTVVELEDEIACLCEEGVTTLTLDLRQLDAIDSVGARAIAWGGAACKKRGRDFAVIPGSPVVHRALAEAGAEGLLARDPVEAGALPLVPGASNGLPRNTSTALVKNL